MLVRKRISAKSIPEIKDEEKTKMFRNVNRMLCVGAELNRHKRSP